MLRKALRRYANQLDRWADSHPAYASVLRAVAHRLRHILRDTPRTHTEYGQSIYGEIVTVETPEPGEPIYTREVTEWRRLT